MLVNRDDKSAKRLNTTVTHNRSNTLQISSEQTPTTKTDFVEIYPSHLQTSNYEFPGTGHGVQQCIGAVKAAGVHPKSGALH